MTEQSAARTAAGDIVALQLWVGFDRRRAAVVTITNGRRTALRSGSPKSMREIFQILQLANGQLLTDADARRQLAALGVTDRVCTAVGCTAVLPIGGQWCSTCGIPHDVQVP